MNAAAFVFGIVPGLIMAGAAIVAALALWRLAVNAEGRRHDSAIQQLLSIFGPASAAAQQDPKQLLVWYPLAQRSRKLFPEAFAAIDTAGGGAFPFTKEQVQSAHARCSADWLAWELAHNAEFSLKVAQVEDEIARAGHASPLLRTRLAAVEQQKLERYQQRYEEYIRTAKALAALSND